METSTERRDQTPTKEKKQRENKMLTCETIRQKLNEVTSLILAGGGLHFCVVSGLLHRLAI